MSFFQNFAYPLDGVNQKTMTTFFLKNMIWLENSKSVYALPMLCQAGQAGHFGLCHNSIRFQFSLLLHSTLTPTCLQVWQFFQSYKFSDSNFGHSGHHAVTVRHLSYFFLQPHLKKACLILPVRVKMRRLT